MNKHIVHVPPARVEGITIKNFRALRDVKLNPLSPITALLGPNGSGKSTVFDVFAVLSECFNSGLRKAWDKRGRFKELRSRDSEGPIVFEVRYRELPGTPVITYHLAINEGKQGPFVYEE
jgi:predicted ATPase